MRAHVLGSVVVAAVVMGGGMQVAEAAFTPIAPPFPGEKSQLDILQHVYGGTFNAVGNDFSNGVVTAVRVKDTLDTLWTTDGMDASAKAVFAKFDQNFGFFEGESGGSFNSLFNVTQKGFNPANSVADITINGTFRFARSGTQGVTVTSNPSDNPGGFDHMVTYKIVGLESVGKYPVMMLFFEDRRFNNADFDYNDLVVEVRGARIIPTPAAFGAGLVMLAGAMLRRRGVQA
jgi:hypothetical protein